MVGQMTRLLLVKLQSVPHWAIENCRVTVLAILQHQRYARFDISGILVFFAELLLLEIQL